MSKIKEAEKLGFLATILQRIPQASNALVNVRVSLQDVLANWQGYAALEEDQNVLAAEGAEFASRVTEVWEDAKPELLMALGILAGGMGTTVEALLTELGE